jgi:superfamily II DNA/RNA helicase
VHRIGRTGRAGSTGVAVTLVDWDDIPRWQLINKALDLGFDDPPETYSTSPWVYSDLDVPETATGRLPRSQRTREGLDAETLEDLGETGKRNRPTQSGGRDSGGRSSGGRTSGGRDSGGRGDSRGPSASRQDERTPDGEPAGGGASRPRRRTRGTGSATADAGSAPAAAGTSESAPEGSSSGSGDGGGSRPRRRRRRGGSGRGGSESAA